MKKKIEKKNLKKIELKKKKLKKKLEKKIRKKNFETKKLCIVRFFINKPLKKNDKKNWKKKK